MLTKSDLHEIKTLIQTETRTVVQEELGPVKKDVSGLRDDVGTLKQDVSGLKDDVGTLKQDVSGLKKDMKYVKKTVGVIVKRFDEENTHLRKRVTKIENHLHLPQP